jgi:hypothetical protein
MVLLGRVDAGTTPAATSSQWVFQTSVDVTLLLLLYHIVYMYTLGYCLPLACVLGDEYTLAYVNMYMPVHAPKNVIGTILLPSSTQHQQSYLQYGNAITPTPHMPNSVSQRASVPCSTHIHDYCSKTCQNQLPPCSALPMHLASFAYISVPNKKCNPHTPSPTTRSPPRIHMLVPPPFFYPLFFPAG